MTTGLTYSTYVSQIATMAVVDQTDSNFLAVLPQMITYAENRICRKLDFLFTQTSVTGNTLTAGVRSITIPAGTLVTTQQINLITPVGTTNPEIGTRTALLPVTKEFLDMVYGSSLSTAQPQYYAIFNDNVFYFGPFPDQAYAIEIVGTARPASLSATNTTTFISTYFPDVMIMASMIYISAYQRNFGRQNDDPQMAQSYEAQFQSLMTDAVVEEARKKYEASGWTSKSPATAATPSRG